MIAKFQWVGVMSQSAAAADDDELCSPSCMQYFIKVVELC